MVDSSTAQPNNLDTSYGAYVYGATVTYPINNTSATPSIYGRGGRLGAISCNGTYCTAAGSYKNATNDTATPWVVSSSDTGATWVYTIDQGTNAVSDLGVFGGFTGTQMSQTTLKK